MAVCCYICRQIHSGSLILDALFNDNSHPPSQTLTRGNTGAGSQRVWGYTIIYARMKHGIEDSDHSRQIEQRPEYEGTERDSTGKWSFDHPPVTHNLPG